MLANMKEKKNAFELLIVYVRELKVKHPRFFLINFYIILPISRNFLILYIKKLEILSRTSIAFIIGGAVDGNTFFL